MPGAVDENDSLSKPEMIDADNERPPRSINEAKKRGKKKAKALIKKIKKQMKPKKEPIAVTPDPTKRKKIQSTVKDIFKGKDLKKEA